MPVIANKKRRQCTPKDGDTSRRPIGFDVALENDFVEGVEELTTSEYGSAPAG